MVGIITSICQQEGISWTALSDDWVLELSKDGVTSKIFGYKFSLNDAASTAIAGDKVAMFQLLRQHDVPAVEHRLIRSKVSYTSNWQQGLGRVVIKPLDGTSGHAV